MVKQFICGLGVFLMILTAMAGCASMAGPSDEEQVQSLLDAWKAATIAKDKDQIMANISADFKHDGYEYEAENKEALRAFLDECDAEGYFDNVEISFDNATTAIEGDTATITAIDYTNDQGSVTIDLTGKKGKDGWKISDMTIVGL